MKILFVDDDPLQLKIITKTFKNLGYEVVGASSGKSALEMIPTFTPNIIVSDGEMPEMNGIELAFNLKDSNIPFFILTSRSMVKNKAESKNYIKSSMLKSESPRSISYTIGLIERGIFPGYF
ncbi:MAG: response regulator [Oligoflexales bacterium]